VLSAADVAFGNLEGVLLDGGTPGKKCSNPEACYLFRSPTRYADHYKHAGFDVLSLANNHARDFGEEGRSSSMEAIAARGMHHSGREGDFASLTVRDSHVAFLAFAVTKNSNMMLDYERAFASLPLMTSLWFRFMVVLKASMSRTSRLRTRSTTMSPEAILSGSPEALSMPVPTWLSDTGLTSFAAWSATRSD